jgi:hypothetical protein
MFETVDLYCERLGPGLWAEPVNAFTNIGFLIAAWLVWRLAHRLSAISPRIWVLVGLLAAIGVGSGLFHSFATNWARILDVVPILLFQLVYVWSYCRRIVQIRFGYAVGVLIAYFVAAIAGRQFPHLLNGSLIYAPAVLVLLALGVYHSATRRVERYAVLSATGVFLVSLTFRTIDNIVCADFPLGTHFMWHVCNAIVLYLLMSGFLANVRSEERPKNSLKRTPENIAALS